MYCYPSILFSSSPSSHAYNIVPFAVPVPSKPSALRKSDDQIRQNLRSRSCAIAASSWLSKPMYGVQPLSGCDMRWYRGARCICLPMLITYRLCVNTYISVATSRIKSVSYGDNLCIRGCSCSPIDLVIPCDKGLNEGARNFKSRRELADGFPFHPFHLLVEMYLGS